MNISRKFWCGLLVCCFVSEWPLAYSDDPSVLTPRLRPGPVGVQEQLSFELPWEHVLVPWAVTPDEGRKARLWVGGRIDLPHRLGRLPSDTGAQAKILTMVLSSFKRLEQGYKFEGLVSEKDSRRIRTALENKSLIAEVPQWRW